MTQLGRSNNGGIGDVHTVVHLVTLLQSAQNGHCRLHGWLTHQDLLETTLQGGIFLYVFAVLVERRRPHTVQLTARQSGLKHIACIHRALCFTGAHHGVNLIDKQNDASLVLGHLF